MKLDRDLPENVHDFVDQISNTKSYIQRCIKILIKETSKHKLDYGQLRYIFRRVRELCKLEICRIDFEQNLIFIKEGKGKKDRVVPFGNKRKESLVV